MTRAVAAISAILMAALQLVIVCCTSTQAQTQTAPPESTIWDHNGSVMYLVANGSSREIFYQKPRPGMLEAGARPGSLLFHGEINNGQYLGSAYIFNLPSYFACGAKGNSCTRIAAGRGARTAHN
jgi:hypothetical protein